MLLFSWISNVFVLQLPHWIIEVEKSWKTLISEKSATRLTSKYAAEFDNIICDLKFAHCSEYKWHPRFFTVNTRPAREANKMAADHSSPCTTWYTVSTRVLITWLALLCCGDCPLTVWLCSGRCVCSCLWSVFCFVPAVVADVVGGHRERRDTGMFCRSYRTAVHTGSRLPRLCSGNGGTEDRSCTVKIKRKSTTHYKL